MPIAKRVVIIAGEESGDIHAAALIRQLKENCPSIQISGIGGKHMQEAGAELVSDLARYGVTGVTEVLRYLKILRQAMQAIKLHLTVTKPDLLILVDYPGFNLRLARYAKKKLGLKILYYISPQIWAWKAKRIHLIKECVDHMAVIFPFEKQIYEQAGVPVHFVGHPLVETMTTPRDPLTCRKELGLPVDGRIIALLPGSRTHEIERHMPVLIKTAERLSQAHSNIHYVIPIARTLNRKKITHYFAASNLPVTFIEGQAIECLMAADFVIVASGTASLECALLNKPMCIIYKASTITYIAAMKLIRVKFLGLCNLLANKMIVPEFLQDDCNYIELSRYIENFYKDKTQPEYMTNQLKELKDSLSSNKSDCTLIDLTMRELFAKNT